MAIPIGFEYKINGEKVELRIWQRPFKKDFPFKLKRGYSIMGTSKTPVTTDSSYLDKSLVVKVEDISKNSAIKAAKNLENILSPLIMPSDIILKWGEKVEEVYHKIREVLRPPREGYTAELNDHNNVVFTLDYNSTVKKGLKEYFGDEKFKRIFGCLNSGDYRILATNTSSKKIDSVNPRNPKVDIMLENGLRLISTSDYNCIGV